MNREITIGRDTRSDIVLGSVCVYASNNHATIYMDGQQLMYRDVSRNGTVINNVMVHNRAVPIHYGDTIMIAGRYNLSWNQIEEFFPQNRQSYRESNYSMSTPYERRSEEPDFSWNWGAFMLYPLWGFWNGCWWAILIAIFFGWTIIPNILFGAYGSKWAWSNKQWRDAEEFNSMQAAWRPWGIAIFVLNILIIVSILAFGFALIGALFSAV